MDALKAEIERKRKATEELRAKAGGGGGGEVGGSKFLRQGDVRILQDREHQEAQRKLDEERRLAAASRSVAAAVAAPVSVAPDVKEERKVKANVDKNDVNDDDEDDDDDEDESDDEESLGAGKKGPGKGKDKGKAKAPKSKSEGPAAYSLVPGLAKEKVVYKYFRSLLKLWDNELRVREPAECISAKGKLETKTFKQCKDHIKPLLKMCKKKTVEVDILDKLFDIVKSCEEGNFRVAHDHYYIAAIGNAAWPIGVTSIGIHERSSRERINTQKVAHVMNNELQRKYLTSVKRLLTFAQSMRPDVPPSMKVT